MKHSYTPKAYKLVRYLQEEPKARERKNKNRALVNLLTHEYGFILRGLQDGSISKEALTNFVKDILYYERMWRKILEQEPHLQGSDYGDKDELERKAQQELGYGGNSHLTGKSNVE